MANEAFSPKILSENFFSNQEWTLVKISPRSEDCVLRNFISLCLWIRGTGPEIWGNINQAKVDLKKSPKGRPSRHSIHILTPSVLFDRSFTTSSCFRWRCEKKRDAENFHPLPSSCLPKTVKKFLILRSILITINFSNAILIFKSTSIFFLYIFFFYITKSMHQCFWKFRKIIRGKREGKRGKRKGKSFNGSARSRSTVIEGEPWIVSRCWDTRCSFPWLFTIFIFPTARKYHGFRNPCTSTHARFEINPWWDDRRSRSGTLVYLKNYWNCGKFYEYF